MSEHGIEGGIGQIGSARSEKEKPCDCPGCAAQRFAYTVEAERGTLGTFPFPNAPSTMKLQ